MCSFKGKNVFLPVNGSCDKEIDYELNMTNFEDCIIHDNCCIKNNQLIQNTEIYSYSIITGNGEITYETGSLCGEDTTVLLGNEIGKRSTPINISFLHYKMYS